MQLSQGHREEAGGSRLARRRQSLDEGPRHSPAWMGPTREPDCSSEEEGFGRTERG